MSSMLGSACIWLPLHSVAAFVNFWSQHMACHLQALWILQPGNARGSLNWVLHVYMLSIFTSTSKAAEHLQHSLRSNPTAWILLAVRACLQERGASSGECGEELLPVDLCAPLNTDAEVALFFKLYQEDTCNDCDGSDGFSTMFGLFTATMMAQL